MYMIQDNIFPKQTDPAELLSAVQNGLRAVVKKLAGSSFIDKHSLQDSLGNPLLYLAIKKIQHTPGQEEKETAIHIAIDLIQTGYPVNRANSRGHSPLYKAVQIGISQIVHLLIKKGAVLDPASSVGMKRHQPTIATLTTMALLTAVVGGQLKVVELCLRENPFLVSMEGDVTDLSRRTFLEVTALQCAIWALDYPMCALLIRYLSKKEVQEQIRDLEQRKDIMRQHGMCYTFEPLLAQYDAYIRNAPYWTYTQRCIAWQWGVGAEQGKMPAWLCYAFTEPGIQAAWVSPKEEARLHTRVFSQDFKKFHKTLRAGYGFMRGKAERVGAETGWGGVYSSRTSADPGDPNPAEQAPFVYDRQVLHYYSIWAKKAYCSLKTSIDNEVTAIR